MKLNEIDIQLKDYDSSPREAAARIWHQWQHYRLLSSQLNSSLQAVWEYGSMEE